MRRNNVDLIERAKTPTREDALAARLKSLRNQDEASPSSSKASPHLEKSPAPVSQSASPLAAKSKPPTTKQEVDDDDVDALFQTDDQTLEELLGDVGADEGFAAAAEPNDAQVKALLEELSQSIPKDDETQEKKMAEDEKKDDSDDSDGEEMNREVDDVIARFRDEIELEKSIEKDDSPEREDSDEEAGRAGQDTPSKDTALDLPDVPTNLQDLPSSQSARAASADLDDITARMAALRAPSNTEDDLSLPSVPTSKPSGKPVNRLTSKTNYTDEDMDGWCTVCLEDATLRCLGCDDDVYCTRCWREMHIGPSAGFDERSHKAVQFTKKQKKEKRKVALGA